MTNEEVSLAVSDDDEIPGWDYFLQCWKETSLTAVDPGENIVEDPCYRNLTRLKRLGNDRASWKTAANQGYDCQRLKETSNTSISLSTPYNITSKAKPLLVL